MDVGSALAQGPLRMSAEEVTRTEEYVKSYNAALRAENKGGTQDMGKDDFLRLLITQLRYQDPLKPMEDKEFIAQMAQFSSLEQTKNMADALTKMNDNMVASQERNNALSFLGKYVEVLRDDGKMESGKVDSIDPRNSMLKVNGQLYQTNQLVSVSDQVVITKPILENESIDVNEQNVVEGEQSL